MYPLSLSTAASFSPSLVEVIPRHRFVLPTEVSSVQVTPESEEVQTFPLSTTAAILVQSLEQMMLSHDCSPGELTVLIAAQLAPESTEAQIFLLRVVAKALVPSLEQVTLNQLSEVPDQVLFVNFAPELEEYQMFPSETAMTLVPSLEDVMPFHSFVLPTEVSSVQVSPESAEVQRFPSYTWAASLVPSLEEVMPRQSNSVVVPDVASAWLQVAPESWEYQMYSLSPVVEVAASLVKSLEEVMLRQRLFGESVFSVQVAPESTESQILPVQTAAASLVPSLEDVMSFHSCVPVAVTALQSREPRAGATAHSSVRTRTSNR